MMLRTRRHGADSRLIERFLLLVCALTHVVFDVFHLPSPSLRTQTRQAIEYVSGEEGLRPKSYFTVFFFRRVHPHARPEVFNGPWLLLWSRGGRPDSATGGHRSFRVPVFSQSAPCNLTFSLSLDNLPVWAAALAAGAPRVQLRTWYAAWVEWVASER